jgi:hypothetical protein
MNAIAKSHDLVRSVGTSEASFGVLSVIVFMRWWGLAGAAASMTVTSAAASIVVCITYRAFFARKTNVCSVEDWAKHA